MKQEYLTFFTEIQKYVSGVHFLRAGASLELIQFAERSLGIEFPDFYREFLQLCNGGSLFYDKVVMWHIPENGNGLDLLKVNSRKWAGMPQSSMVIATYNFGDDICLTQSEKGLFSAVAQWDHEIGQFSRRWETLGTWLDYEISVGHEQYNYNGEYRPNIIQKIFSLFTDKK